MHKDRDYLTVRGNKKAKRGTEGDAEGTDFISNCVHERVRKYRDRDISGFFHGIQRGSR